jgi:hypothetical protein
MVPMIVWITPYGEVPVSLQDLADAGIRYIEDGKPCEPEMNVWLLHDFLTYYAEEIA